MLSFLIPKELGFFDLFDEMASCAVEGSNVFLEMLDHYGDLPAKVRRLRDIEHHADEISHHAIEMLHKTFVTPMDRDQIHTLVSRMDDVIDLTDGAGRRLMMYDVKAPTPELKELALVLHHATLEIQKAVHSLRNLKNSAQIKQCCIEINKLENDGDALRDAVVAKLFKEETNAVQVLRWKEIYEDVETAIDRCEDVADVIEGVVLENA
jgi:predicted phosphate transport protein (TIGR00153 family)